VSEAERLALDLAKVSPQGLHESRVKIENAQIIFSADSKHVFTDSCSWREDKASPRYCRNAEFTFESYLPDRKFLTRYSVTCKTCYGDSGPAIHLYCSYCDEILTGSIAGPGGKVTDHLITIRHVYQEASAFRDYFEEKGLPQGIVYQQASQYVRTLEEWSETVRYQKNSLKKPDFEALLGALRRKLSQVCEFGKLNFEQRYDGSMRGQVPQEYRASNGTKAVFTMKNDLGPAAGSVGNDLGSTYVPIPNSFGPNGTAASAQAFGHTDISQLRHLREGWQIALVGNSDAEAATLSFRCLLRALALHFLATVSKLVSTN
jgi:hypothetical protein